MVRAAYSSGKPAIGVGAGNGPAYIHRSADIPRAVRDILRSKTFDNGTVCASEPVSYTHLLVPSASSGRAAASQTASAKAVQAARQAERVPVSRAPAKFVSVGGA